MTSEVRAEAGGPTFEFEPHNCFACGELNEHGLQLKLHLEERRSWTEFVLDDRFEGWRGVTHGGIIATVLDEVMAWALVAEDNWGVTARMTIDFKRPVPVGTSVRAEGWIVHNRRRLVDTAGQIVDANGTLLASAEAVYVAANEERKRELMARYGVRIRNARARGEGLSK
ncbi:MAG TPA: PaaI family thioesterase [Verrucomicrobiae bacterium]|nr:PaaI family thioesterase [Verrucomicrobiae bacterium]